MNVFVNGIPMGMPMGGAMPGLGAMRSSSMPITPLETVQQKPVFKTHVPNSVHTSKWSIDQVPLVKPSQVTQIVFDQLLEGLGAEFVRRLSSTTILVKSPKRPNDLQIRVNVAFSRIELTLVQDSAQPQTVTQTLDSLPPSVHWSEWCSRVTKQIVDQSK